MNNAGYSSLAPYYDIFIDWGKRLEREIPFILQAAGELGVREPRALDIGCGTGYHLRALKEAGFRVQGTEPSESLHRLAEGNLAGVEIFPVPMESLGLLAGSCGPWELVTCLGNTLAHLSPGKLHLFSRGLVEAVAHPGLAVLHLLNYEKILSERPGRLPVKTVETGDACYSFERLYSYTGQGVEFTVEVRKDGSLVATDRETLYPLTTDILVESLDKAGFSQIQLYGDFSRRVPYSARSDNLVLVVKKC